MKRFLPALFFLLPMLSFSQDDPILHWVKTAGAIGYDVAYGVTTDAQGNVYNTGVFNATMDFDPGPGVFTLTQTGNSPDGYVQKLDSQGNFVWAKRMGGADGNFFSHIKTMPNGDILLGGSFNGTVDFNPNSGTFNLTSTLMLNPVYKSYDVVLVRLDADGNFIWAKKFGGTQADSIESLVVDPTGNIYVTGIFGETGDFDPGAANYNMTATGTWDTFIVKLDTDGDFQWAGRIGGESDARPTELLIGANGNLFMSGSYYMSVDVNPGSGEHWIPAGEPDQFGQYSIGTFVTEFDTNGALVWEKHFYRLSNSAMGIASDGNLIVSGMFRGEVDLDPGDGEAVYNSVGMFNGFGIVKLDNAGNFMWAQEMGSISAMYPKKIIALPNDEFLMAGTFTTTVNLPGSENLSITALGSGMTADVFLVRFDANGNAVWAETYGGLLDDAIEDIRFTQPGLLYASGNFEGTSDMDPGSGEFNVTANGSHDLYVMRLGPEELGLEEAVASGFSMYPNPSNGLVNFTFDPHLTGKTTTVYSMLGQRVTSFEINTLQQQIQLPSGQYLIQPEGEKALKLIVK